MTLRLSDLETGNNLATLQGHTRGITALVVFPDRQRALSGSFDNTLKLWDLKKNEIISDFENLGQSPTALSVLSHQDIIVGSSNGSLYIFNFETNTTIATLQGHTDSVNAVAVLSDGRRAISGSSDNTLRLWDLEACTAIATLQGHTHWVAAVAVLPDGRRAISGSWDNTLRLWDLVAGTTIATFVGDDAVTAVAVSPDGRVAVAGDSRGRVMVFDLPPS